MIDDKKMLLKDKKLIYNRYKSFIDTYVFKKKYTPQEALKIWDKHGNTLRNLIKEWYKYDLTPAWKLSTLKKAKLILYEFCKCKNSYSECICENDEKRMYILLKIIAEFDAERLLNYRKRLFAGEKLDIAKILDRPRYSFQIIQRPIDKLLDQYFKGMKETGYENERKVYITEKGKKYHLANCPYCRHNVHRQKVRHIIAESYGLEPCQCVIKERERQEQENRFMTVFIDESVRENPCRILDPTLREYQSVYSYIICKGRLESEAEIEECNTVTTEAGLCDANMNNNQVAVEAISLVLIRLAFSLGFERNVIIYTDNYSAAESWDSDKKNKFLEGLFTSVNVICIPRRENKVADRIGREKGFFSVSREMMDEMIFKCQMFDNYIDRNHLTQYVECMQKLA